MVHGEWCKHGENVEALENLIPHLKPPSYDTTTTNGEKITNFNRITDIDMKNEVKKIGNTLIDTYSESNEINDKCTVEDEKNNFLNNCEKVQAQQNNEGPVWILPPDDGQKKKCKKKKKRN